MTLANSSVAPEEALRLGSKSLDPVLNPYGFKFEFRGAGTGSGGRFASGSYVNGDRSLELHYRHALGLVSYSIGDCSLSHENYLRFLGVYGQNSYPDFPADPIHSFHSLARDIELYCGDFLQGSGQQFRQFAEELKLDPNKFSQLP